MVLRYKAAKGLLWHFAATYSWKSVEFLVSIALARIFLPEEFGIVALCYLVVNMSYIFSNFGVNSLVIQRKEISKIQIDSAYYLSTLFSVFVYVAIYLSAPSIAVFYGDDKLVILLRTVALAIPIASLGNTHSAILEKNLDFKRLFVPKVVPWIVYSIVTIGLALIGYGVWSVVYGIIAMQTTGTIIIWIVSLYRPGFRIRLGFAKEIWDFGKYIVGIAILSYALTSGIEVYVGKAFGMAVLGYFSIGNKIATLMSKNVTSLVNRVLFSAFSRIQDNLIELAVSFSKIIEYVLLVVTPAILGLIMLAPDLIRVIYTDKWLPAVPILQILAVSGFFMSLDDIMVSVIIATKNQDKLAVSKVIQILSLVFFIMALSSLGSTGIAISVSLAFMLGFIVNMLFVSRILRNNMFFLFIKCHYVFLSAAAMGTVVSIFKSAIGINGLLSLLLIVVLGAISYLIAILLLNHKIFVRIYRFGMNLRLAE